MLKEAITAVAVTTVLAAAGTIGAITHAVNTEQERQAVLQVQVDTADVQAGAVGERRVHGQEVIEEARQRAARELSKARADFTNAAHAASKTIKAAAADVNVGREKDQVAAAEKKAGDGQTARDVRAQITVVKKAASAAKKKVADHKAKVKAEAERRARERAQAAQSSSTQARGQSASGGKRSSPPAKAKPGASQSSGWFNEMRSILNSVGGGGIPLVQYDGNCGGVNAAACSVRGTIRVNGQIASWRHSRKVWAMTHELAHQRQFAVWGTLMASHTYKTMFGSNIELLANCMSSAHGATDHGHHCSASQIKWANGIWSGRVSN